MNTALDLGDRAAYLNIVAAYKLTAPREEHQALDELYQLVARRKDCFERYREEGACHIAASVFLMDGALERGLFIKHRKVGQWTQPGGHADGELNIYQVARRELEEEVGVVIEPSDFLDPLPFDLRRYDFESCIYGYRKSIFNAFFLARLPQGQYPVNREPEHCDGIMWATPDMARELVCGDAIEVALIGKWEKALARLRAEGR